MSSPSAGTIKLAVGYGVMLLATVALFFWIRNYGETLVALPAEPGSRPTRVAAGHDEVLLHVLLALAAVIGLGRTVGALFRYVGQPQVMGEVLTGILLGPSLLGQIAPELATFLLPPSIGPFLEVIAQLGVVLYMFVIGMELNAGLLRKHGHAAIAISHASIVAPFILGAGLALYLYPRLCSENVTFTSFALFLGVAMAITAFPVLARILTDRGISRTELGVVALTCAATDDVTAWCLLAIVVGVAQAQVTSGLTVALWSLLYIAFVLLVARPVIQRWVARYDEEHLPQAAVAFVFVALLLSALTTELIGIHAIFGAFLLGAVIPHDSAIARAMTSKLEDLVTVLLLPAFFAFTGMRTQIGLIQGLEQWLLCALIILVATAGKFGGTLLAARFTGLSWRTSSALGILMNTRGLMELIVLNIGLDLGVISPTLFAMMVVMALVTTFMTTPILHFLVHSPTTAVRRDRQPAHAGQA